MPFDSTSLQTQSLNEHWYAKLCEVLPAGVNSPVRSCKSMGTYTPVIIKGEQDRIYDVEGREYIDYCGSWGALIHGHAHPAIVDAACRRIYDGSSFGMTTVVEEQFARKLTRLIDSVEKIRCVSSGTEATMAALRLARGFTKRPLIIKFTGNYHGSSDMLLVKAGSGVSVLPESTSAGIPSELVSNTICLPFNDISTLETFFKNPLNRTRIAGVIVEPIAGNMGTVPADKAFLQKLRQLTYENGSVLIFDEVITGFRVGLKGAQGLYGIKPDLTCFGKIMGGGFPAAAFGGRAEIMDHLAPLGAVYQGGTLSGNPVAMEAGLQALKMLEIDGFYEELERKTRLLTDPIRDYFLQHNINACLQRVGSMFTIFFGRRHVHNAEDAKGCDFHLFASFFRYMLERGIYFPPLQMEACFVSMAHTDKHLLETANTVLDFAKSIHN